MAQGLEQFDQVHCGKVRDVGNPQWAKEAGYVLKCMLMRVRITDERSSNGDNLPGRTT